MTGRDKGFSIACYIEKVILNATLQQYHRTIFRNENNNDIHIYIIYILRMIKNFNYMHIFSLHEKFLFNHTIIIVLIFLYSLLSIQTLFDIFMTYMSINNIPQFKFCVGRTRGLIPHFCRVTGTFKCKRKKYIYVVYLKIIIKKKK